MTILSRSSEPWYIGFNLDPSPTPMNHKHQSSWISPLVRGAIQRSLNLLLWPLLVAMACLFSSCATMNEEVKLKKGGSGTYRLDWDMSKMLEMHGALQGIGADSLQTDNKRHDSTMYFSSLKDSVPNINDPNHILDKARLHMVMDEQAKQFDIELILDFDSVGDINAMYRLLHNFSDDSSHDPKLQYAQMADGSHPVFSLQGNKLVRRQTPAAAESMDDQSQGLLDLLTAGTTFRSTYSFPKKAKHSTIPDSKIVNGNTVVVEKQFADLTTHPEEMEGEIVFK